MPDINTRKIFMINEPPSEFREHAIIWGDDKVSRLWDYYSKTEPFCDNYFSKAFGKHIIEKSGLDLTARMNILDFGCGPGFVFYYVQRMGLKCKYTGLDFSSRSIKETLKRGAGNENFMGAYLIEKLPSDLLTNSYNAVFLVETIEHLSDEHLNATLNEIYRLLKNGGAVVITTPNEEDLSRSSKFCPECGAIFHEWQHVRSWGINKLIRFMQTKGFELGSAKTLDFGALGIGLVPVTKRIKRMCKSILGWESTNPHMIAVFNKN